MTQTLIISALFGVTCALLFKSAPLSLSFERKLLPLFLKSLRYPYRFPKNFSKTLSMVAK